MIIFGATARSKTVGSGQFYCPVCQSDRSYERKQAKRYFSLYFIPLIPMGDLGEFIECQSCHRVFTPDVLAFKAPEPETGVAGMINTAQARLQAGLPVEYLVRDLNLAGLERDMAWGVVNTAIGAARRVCKACDLSYASTVATCRECGQPLDT